MSPAETSKEEEEKEQLIESAAEGRGGNSLVCSELKLLVIMKFIADGLRSYACPCTWRKMHQLNDSSEMLLDGWGFFFTVSLSAQNRRVFWPVEVNVFNGIGRIMNLSMN